MVPRHLGIIMDGNRRFAKRLMLKPWKGHEWGKQKIEDVLDWCREYDIRELTLYTLSLQNFERPKEEFDFLMKLFAEGFEQLKDDNRLYEHKIKVNFIGRLWKLPDNIRHMMSVIMENTRDHDQYTINFALAYGGREEVVDAARKIAQQVQQGTLDVEQINEDVFKKELYLANEPDLIIRTGGEHRTSNFLAYQGAYAEYIFVEKMWPDFEKEDFVSCINEFKKRKRRFGR